MIVSSARTRRLHSLSRRSTVDGIVDTGAGCSPGRVDGIIGPRTLSALRTCLDRFQTPPSIRGILAEFTSRYENSTEMGPSEAIQAYQP